MWRTTSSALLACLALAAPAAAAPELVKVGDFHAPVHVAAPAGDPRLFVVQQNGKVMVGGSVYLDVSGETLTDGSERGLLSIAFAPDFAASGLSYVFLTARPDGDLLVLEHRQMAGEPNRADPASRREVLRVDHPVHSNHNGGQLAFGPDGKLYVATGDGGGADDPGGNARNLGSPLGKILRIERTGAAAADNPFRAPGQHPAVWSYGLRNPWRFSFDRETGDLVIGDVGQGRTEEINWAPASSGGGRGLNFGWDCYEGNAFRATQCPQGEFEHTRPAYALSQDDGLCAITGGFVVRDPGLPTLRGRYLYGDNCLPRLHSVTLGAQDRRAETTLDVDKPTSLGEDGCGRLYVASIPGYAHAPGSVYRIQDGEPSPCGGAPAPVGPGTDPGPAAACNPRVLHRRAQRPLRRGLVVRVRTSAACSVSVSARLGRRIRFRSATVPAAAGDRAVRLQLSRRAKARLRRALRRRSRLVRVTARAGTQTATARLRVRR